MKSILVPVEDHDRTENILSTALLFARIFGSRMTGFALAPATTPFLAADVVGASIIYEPLVEHNEERSAQARALFHAFMGREKVRAAGEGVEGPSWGWKDNVPPGDHMVGYLGRVYDITVVGRPGQQMSGPRALTLDAALFDSGRPVLIAPPERPQITRSPAVFSRISFVADSTTEPIVQSCVNPQRSRKASRIFDPRGVCTTSG